jgi:hypothetical protein
MDSTNDIKEICMNLKEINPDKTPELFYPDVTQFTDVIDAKGTTRVYTETLDVSPSETDVRLRSSCKHRSGKPLPAYQEMRLANGKMQLWYIEPGEPFDIVVDGDEIPSYPDWVETLAAEGYVIQENETSPDYWETYEFTKFKTEKADTDRTKSKVNRDELTVADETASIDADLAVAGRVITDDVFPIKIVVPATTTITITQD